MRHHFQNFNLSKYENFNAYYQFAIDFEIEEEIAFDMAYFRSYNTIPIEDLINKGPSNEDHLNRYTNTLCKKYNVTNEEDKLKIKSALKDQLYRFSEAVQNEIINYNDVE